MENKEQKQVTNEQLMEKLNKVEDMLENVCVALMCQNNVSEMYLSRRAELADTSEDVKLCMAGLKALAQSTENLKTDAYREAESHMVLLKSDGLSLDEILKIILDI